MHLLSRQRKPRDVIFVRKPAENKIRVSEQIFSKHLANNKLANYHYIWDTCTVSNLNGSPQAKLQAAASHLACSRPLTSIAFFFCVLLRRFSRKRETQSGRFTMFKKIYFYKGSLLEELTRRKRKAKLGNCCTIPLHQLEKYNFTHRASQ